MQHFFKTLRYLRYYKREALLNILFNILTALFTIASFLVLKPFLDILFVEQAVAPIATEPSMGFIAYYKHLFNQALGNYIELSGKKAGLLLVSTLVVATFLCKNLFRYLALYAMAPVRFGIEKRIRLALYQKLLCLPLAYYSEEKKGDLMSRISLDVQEIQWSVLQSVEVVVRSPIMIFGSLAVMFYISPQLTAFSFILILFVGFIIGGIGKTLKRSSKKAQVSHGKILSILEESIGGLRIIRAFNAENHQTNHFNQENEYYASLMKRIMRRKDLSSPTTEFLGIAVVVVLLLYGGNLVFEGAFSASTFVVFISMFYNIIDPAKAFSNAYYAIQKGSAAIERVDEIMYQEEEDKLPSTDLTATFEQALEFRNVSFSYATGEQVLSKINLIIKKGEKIALVGSSGAGKSTIADLIPRFYELEEGAILLDKTNTKSLNIKSLRSLISIVSQQAILFNDTIYNNIVLGLENIDEAAVIKAAKIANAHDFILNCSEGYQTIVGDGGNKLSGGQRQRLTIARAILRDSPILILDEATSSLDAASELLVQQALEQAMHNRTSIIIAHRFSSIQHVDKIVVLEQGKIVEIGSPDSLLAQNGVYAKLSRLQNL
jgi:subfamily B ATP-binding cassette protein MsbA